MFKILFVILLYSSISLGQGTTGIQNIKPPDLIFDSIRLSNLKNPQQRFNPTKFYINGEEFSAEQMSVVFINLKRIVRVDINRTGDVPNVYIQTKAITFLNYSQIKSKASRTEVLNMPLVVVDDKPQHNLSELRIDESYISKLRYDRNQSTQSNEGTITIKTLDYRRNKKRNPNAVIIK